MAGVPDYSTTAGSNTTVGGVSIAEGMVTGSVNDGMRAMMADSKKWQLDWSGIVTAGSGNAYTVTTNQGFTAYATGLRLTLKADRTNTGAATLNVDGLGAKNLRKIEGGALVALVAGDIVGDAVYDVVFDSVLDVFVATNIAPSLDADLTALAGLSSTGMIARTGAGTAAVRTITGTAPVTVTNGNGVSGNPTIALGSITSIQTTITDSDTAIPTSGAVFDIVPGQSASVSDVAASRAANTIYQNTSQRMMFVTVSSTSTASGSTLEIGPTSGSLQAYSNEQSSVQHVRNVTAPVPPGWFYRYIGTISAWRELV